MESEKHNPILISELMKQYRENIKKKYYEKMGFFEKSINNVKDIYNNIYNNISNKIQIPYTHEDLNSEKNTTNKKIKEYGIFLGNFITNIVVDSVDTYNSYCSNNYEVLEKEDQSQ